MFKVGDLTLIAPVNIKGHTHWKCKCRCGNEKYIRDAHIKSGASTSCGLCGYKEKYPLAHKSWDSMRQRCTNSNAPDYPRYGGRGITVCEEWARFIDFFDDMGNPPMCSTTGQRFTLGRKDNDGPYNKDNCEWQSAREQNMNKSNTLPSYVKVYPQSGNKRNI